MKVETNQGQPTDQLRVQQREGSSRLPNETPNETPNDQGPAAPPGRSPLLVVFLTVFVDLVGFGIIIPLSPFLAREFAATPTEIGFLMAIYSIMQFAFSPFWGGLSDRVGRRPVILLSLFGSVLSYLAFAFSTELWMLFVARGFAGMFGGNISAAHAYMADVTRPEERSKGMGLIGAAFGLGFIFGPIIGGLLGVWGEALGSEPPFGMNFPALGAAALCLSNFVFAIFVLKESLPQERRRSVTKKRKRFEELMRHFRRPLVGPLMLVFFLSGLAMAQMEAMLFSFVADVLGWDLKMASYGFAYVGVMMVITQGWLIRKWMPRFGEARLLTWGLGLFAVSLLAIPLTGGSVALLAVTMTVLALGNGLMRPPNLGLISLATPSDEQGAVMGVTNSLASLGRIIGPMIGGVAYEKLGRGVPFYLGGILALVAFAIVIYESARLPASARSPSVNSD